MSSRLRQGLNVSCAGSQLLAPATVVIASKANFSSRVKLQYFIIRMDSGKMKLKYNVKLTLSQDCALCLNNMGRIVCVADLERNCWAYMFHYLQERN